MEGVCLPLLNSSETVIRVSLTIRKLVNCDILWAQNSEVNASYSQFNYVNFLITLFLYGAAFNILFILGGFGGGGYDRGGRGGGGRV